jgi:hypothetical protein
MYNIANHYLNIFKYLETIITDPRVIYLHPFGATQPENIEMLRDDYYANRPRRGPLFIVYDQEPLNFTYNRPLFDYITKNFVGPFILVSTERDSDEKIKICDHYGFAHVDYFFHIFAAADWYRGHEYSTSYLPPSERQLKKTYITFNRLTSNERVYRSLFVNELYKNNLLDSGYVSFSKDCPDGGNYADNLKKGIANQRIDPLIIEETISNIDQLPELRIDFKEEEHIPNQSMLLTPMEPLMDSFVFVVTETCYWQNKTHLTEKIFKPIVLRMPFILVGCPHNLEYLRSFGFRTFNQYWDESYDRIEDPIKRLQAIVKILKTLSAMTTEDQQSMLKDMHLILEHNYQLFNKPEFISGEWQNLKNSLKNIVQFYQFRPPYTLDAKTGQAIPIVVPTES